MIAASIVSWEDSKLWTYTKGIDNTKGYIYTWVIKDTKVEHILLFGIGIINSHL